MKNLLDESPHDAAGYGMNPILQMRQSALKQVKVLLKTGNLSKPAVGR